MVVGINYDIGLYMMGELVLKEMFGPQNDIYISPNVINEFFDNTYWSFESNQVLTETALDKLGLGNSTGQINNAAKDIANIIKKDGVGKDSRNKIHNRVSKLFEDIAKNLSTKQIMVNGKLKEMDTKKTERALTLLSWVLIISSLVSTLLTIFLGKAGGVVYSIAFAPVIEEASKSISIKGKFDKEYFIVFNIFEASNYIISLGVESAILKSMGIKVPSMKQIIRARAAAVGMHGVTTLIHKLFNSDKFREKFNIGNDQDSKDKCTFASYIITTLVHSSWNAANTFSDTFYRIIVGK